MESVEAHPNTGQLRLEFLDARFGARQIALVDQRGDVDDDGGERRQVSAP
jgi:hypothetical protein